MSVGIGPADGDGTGTGMGAPSAGSLLQLRDRCRGDLTHGRHGGRPCGRGGRGHADRLRTNLGNPSGSFTRLGMTTTYHQSRPAGDDACRSDGTPKCWGNTLYLCIDGGYAVVLGVRSTSRQAAPAVAPVARPLL